MEDLREYVFSIVCACFICSIITILLDKKGTIGNLGKMFCGVFLAITMIRPLGTLSFDAISDWLDRSSLEASDIVEEGTQNRNTSNQAIIKQNTEAYIQDKGKEIGLEIHAEITLDSDYPFEPVCVVISGSAAPYKRTVLNNILVKDLAISKEKIRWI